MLNSLEKNANDVETAKKKRRLPHSKIWVQVSFDRSKPTLKISDGQSTIELSKNDVEVLTDYLLESR